MEAPQGPHACTCQLTVCGTESLKAPAVAANEARANTVQNLTNSGQIMVNTRPYSLPQIHDQKLTTKRPETARLLVRFCNRKLLFNCCPKSGQKPTKFRPVHGQKLPYEITVDSSGRQWSRS